MGLHWRRRNGAGLEFTSVYLDVNLQFVIYSEVKGVNMKNKWKVSFFALLSLIIFTAAYEDLRNNPNVWNANNSTTCSALSDGSSVAVNALLANCFTLTVAGNSHTLAAPTNLRAGAINFKITNSGGVTGFGTNSIYKFPGGTAPTWSTTNGAIDVLTCMSFDGTSLQCVGLTNES